MTLIHQITDTHIPVTGDMRVSENFLELIAYSKSIGPDLLVLTGDLPGEDGNREVYEWIRASLPADIPHIVIPGTGNRKWGLHTFVSFDLRLVGQDIFLDGNTFKKSHEVTRESVVADVAIGISYIYGGARLSYAHIFRTREFSQQDHSHSYGSMAFSYTF